MKKVTLLLLAGMMAIGAGAQKPQPVVNENVSINNCDVVWSRFYKTDKTPEQILATIKMESLFETVDVLDNVVYGLVKPFKVPYRKATVSWVPMWLIDPVTATVQFKKVNGGYNVVFKKIKTVAEQYKGEVANLPESNLLNNYVLKNCTFLKAFVKQGATDMLDDGFDKKVMEILQ